VARASRPRPGRGRTSIAQDVALLERVRERLPVHDRAARHVDQERVELHAPQARRVKQAAPARSRPASLTCASLLMSLCPDMASVCSMTEKW
jgi:hypothetical protein